MSIFTIVVCFRRLIVLHKSEHDEDLCVNFNHHFLFQSYYRHYFLQCGMKVSLFASALSYFSAWFQVDRLIDWLVVLRTVFLSCNERLTDWLIDWLIDSFCFARSIYLDVLYFSLFALVYAHALQGKQESEQLRKLFIGGLTYNTTEDDIREHFGKYGKIVDAVVMMDPQTKKSRCFGFVTYERASMVDEAQKNRPHIIHDRTVEPKRAIPREVRREKKSLVCVCVFFIPL